MGDIHGFKNIKRINQPVESPTERKQHFAEFYKDQDEMVQRAQASRCMDCGVPFCHNGCPLGNLIPDFNDAVHQQDWRQAYDILISTNNFPEFTGRICPAPCEAACVLGINDDAVNIEYIEKTIIERAFDEGWVRPDTPPIHSAFKVAVVGSGPSGLAAASQLNKAGHRVVVYEKSNRIGGLLRYGIPDFKLQKNIVDRRIQLMKESGIEFVVNVNVGVDMSATDILEQYDAIVLCGGAQVPRDLPIPGRQLKGIHFAMEFLEQNNKRVAGDLIPKFQDIEVKNQHVVVIGGGDTGSDCIGTSNRLNAASVTQIEIMSKPSIFRTMDHPWPLWPFTLKVSSSQEEGCDREWAILTKEFIASDEEHVSGIKVVQIQWQKSETGQYKFIEIPDTEKVIPCTKVFLAMGFTHPLQDGLLNDLGVKYNAKNHVEAKKYQTNIEKVFVAGDLRRGQSLVVWAIAEGRESAIAIDEYLNKTKSKLASNERSMYQLA
jgi:glutamate synthase (NADPH/NADH) small chain